MYSSCVFCQQSFDPNQEIERLQIGQRIAFDQSKGRLWVVCGGCTRWNLVPFEDRWETIEDCERQFRGTNVRVSTDNIGMARLDGGTELIRIGKPLLPEFAAWRYGRQFQQRHRRRFWSGAARKVSYPVLFAATPVVAGLAGVLPAALLVGGTIVALHRSLRRPNVRVELPDQTLDLSAEQVREAMLIRDDTDPAGWGLVLPHLAPPDLDYWDPELVPKMAVLYGADARTAASMLLPRLNPAGGDEVVVTEAVRWLEASGGPDRAFRTFARSRFVRMPLDMIETKISTIHAGARLALEMALHEDEERRALAGELTVLERAWRWEERLAHVADGLGFSDEFEEQFEALKRTFGSK